MARSSNRWRKRRSTVTRKRRPAGDGMRILDWVKLLVLLGAIMWLGLGEPLRQLYIILDLLGFH